MAPTWPMEVLAFLPILPSKDYLHPRNIVCTDTVHSSMFAPRELVFTAYTSFTASSTDIGCTTRTAVIGMATPFSAHVDEQPPDPSIIASSVFSHLGFTSCYLSIQSISQMPSPTKRVLSTSLFEKQPTLVTAISSSVPLVSGFLSQPTAATANSSYPQHTQSPSAITGAPRNLIIGFIVAIVAGILLVSIGLAYFCLFRKRRRRRDEAANADRENTKSNGEGENPQLYLQQKVELDDGQRRHEMEAVELSYEVQGVDEIYEMPADEGDGRYARHELKGDECS